LGGLELFLFEGVAVLADGLKGIRALAGLWTGLLFRFHVRWFILHRVEYPVFAENPLSVVHKSAEPFAVSLLFKHEAKSKARVELTVVDLFGCRLVITHVVLLD
jgi:hypothetical protein